MGQLHNKESCIRVDMIHIHNLPRGRPHTHDHHSKGSYDEMISSLNRPLPVSERLVCGKILPFK